MTFCSDIARASGEPLAGTTFWCRAVVFLPIAKPKWGKRPLDVALQNPAFAGWVRAAEALGLAIKVYDPRTAPFATEQIILCGPTGAGLADSNTAPETTADLRALMARAKKVTVPLHFVCTHGQRERCCALYGLSIVKTLRDKRPEDMVLECSHLGGDRFAAVLFLATTGDMLGSLREEHVVDAVSRSLAGSPPLQHWRGSVFQSDLWAVSMAALRNRFPHARVSDLQVDMRTEDIVAIRASVNGQPADFRADLGRTTHIVQPCCVPSTKRLRRVHNTLQNLRLAIQENASA